MSTVTTRWKAKLAIRENLLTAARKRYVWHPTKANRATLDKRKAQVLEAEKVIARHTRVGSVSDRGVELVAGFEGFRAHVYRDAVGVPTQGYGETHGITPGRAWTQTYARERLRQRLNADYLAPVLRYCRSQDFEPTQRQADALASLAYNLGPGIFARGRTIGEAIASHSTRRIADAFLVYDIAGGHKLPGLTRRRQIERGLFLQG